MNQQDNKNTKSPFFYLIIVLAIIMVIGMSINKYFTGSVTLNSQDTAKQSETTDSKNDQLYEFYDEEHLQEHFEKHRDEFDYSSAEEYEKGANRVIYTFGVLHKKEKEDNDDIYYRVNTNELVIVSSDGYIRTYFKPEDGMAYYDRQ